MKIALLGATGMVGSRLLTEALARGHHVTAVARNVESLGNRQGLTVQQGDVRTPGLATALRGQDALLSAMRFSLPAETVIDLARESGAARLMVVGGAGSLEVAPGVQLLDSPDFPEAYRAEAEAGRAFLYRLKEEPSLDWTFLSPSALLQPGERTGSFRLGKDQLLVDGNGQSHISAEDFAVAFIDELERPNHRRQRFTVGY